MPSAANDVSFAMCRSISVDMFQKAMDLDLRWHLMRKTGEVTRIMDRGTSAIQQVLSTGDGLTSLTAFACSAAESLRTCICFSAQRAAHEDFAESSAGRDLGWLEQ